MLRGFGHEGPGRRFGEIEAGEPGLPAQQGQGCQDLHGRSEASGLAQARLESDRGSAILQVNVRQAQGGIVGRGFRR